MISVKMKKYKRGKLGKLILQAESSLMAINCFWKVGPAKINGSSNLL